jgi:hypothetical protein
MDRIDEILYLHEDGVVEMKQGGRVPLQEGGALKKFNFNPNFDASVPPTKKQYKDVFERIFNVTLKGDESLDELGHLYELLAEFQEQIPNLSPRNRGGVYLAGHRS